MFQRTNKLLIDLPEPDYGDKKAALVVQELLGGKFGELSTLNNYLFQSFNFRERKKLKPYFDLVSSITAEELGHVELVSHTINLLFKDTTTVPFDVNDTTKKFEDQGLSNVLYNWNEVDDYLGIEQIFTQTHPETNEPLTVKEGTPIGGEIPDLDSLPEFFAPGLDRDDYNRVAKHLMNHM